MQYRNYRNSYKNIDLVKAQTDSTFQQVDMDLDYINRLKSNSNIYKRLSLSEYNVLIKPQIAKEKESIDEFLNNMKVKYQTKSIDLLKWSSEERIEYKYLKKNYINKQNRARRQVMKSITEERTNKGLRELRVDSQGAVISNEHVEADIPNDSVGTIRNNPLDSFIDEIELIETHDNVSDDQEENAQFIRRSLNDKRLQKILSWCNEYRTRIVGNSQCQLCVNDPTIKPSNVPTFKGDQQHKQHLFQGLICKKWGIHNSSHAGQHTESKQFIRGHPAIQDQDGSLSCPLVDECKSKTNKWVGTNAEKNFHNHVLRKHVPAVEEINLTKEEGYSFMKDYFMNYYNMIFTQQEFDDLSQKRIKKLRTSS